MHAVSWLGTLTACFSTFLFLIRARGVFNDSNRAKTFFNVLWFLASSATLTDPFSFTAQRIYPRGLCAITKVNKLGAIGPITVAIFDTTVFLSISYRMIPPRQSVNIRTRITSFFTGSNIGETSRSLLRTGQLYFLYVSNRPLFCQIDFIQTVRCLVFKGAYSQSCSQHP